MLARLVRKFPIILAIVPFWLITLTVSLINEILFAITWPVRAVFFHPRSISEPVKKEACIAILNWNGEDLLRECLPSVVEAVQYDGGNHEIVVIDNGSTDNSIALLRDKFPRVRVISLDKNYNFVGGYNRGIRDIDKDILVLLNNDMLVKKDFLHPLLESFSDPDVFGVSAQIFFWDSTRRREETGKTRSIWYKGMVGYTHDDPTEGDNREQYIPAFWLGGGSAAVDRKKFMALGGFDALMAPLYMEDVDLSYAAWKRGWKILFCPVSEVLHKHRSSSGRLSRAYLDRIINRNRLLFIWKNITEPGMFFEHLIQLPLVPLRNSWELSGGETVKTFWMAVLRLPLALVRRNQHRIHARMRDSEVFRVANSPFAYKDKYDPLPVVDQGRLKILMVCAYFPTLRSGGGVRMYQQIKALASRHDVSLLAFWDEETDREYFADMEKICRRVVAIRRISTARKMEVPVLPPAIQIDFGDPQFRIALEEMLTADDFNVIQAEFLQVAPHIPPSRRIVRILTHHEVQNAAIQTQMAFTRRPLERAHMALKWARWLNAEISLSKKFDRVVALTPEDAWSIYQYDPRIRLDVIGTGIDLEYFSPDNSPQEPHSLIYVGNFRHTPNVVSVLFLANEVLPLVQNQIPDVKLYIVGANPTPEITALARPGQVIVTGWVDDMRPYIQRSNIFVFPILTGVGLRNKILEAWAMGKPVVTTRLGTAGLTARHQENVWLAENAREFSEGICTLLKDEALRGSIGKHARQYVEEHHTWQTIADQYTDTYRKALHDRGIC